MDKRTYGGPSCFTVLQSEHVGWERLRALWEERRKAWQELHQQKITGKPALCQPCTQKRRERKYISRKKRRLRARGAEGMSCHLWGAPPSITLTQCEPCHCGIHSRRNQREWIDLAFHPFSLWGRMGQALLLSKQNWETEAQRVEATCQRWVGGEQHLDPKSPTPWRTIFPLEQWLSVILRPFWGLTTLKWRGSLRRTRIVKENN